MGYLKHKLIDQMIEQCGCERDEMPDVNDMACRNCRWWTEHNPRQPGTPDGLVQGYCHVTPPLLGGYLAASDSEWWCKEFERPREKAPFNLEMPPRPPRQPEPDR